MTHKYKNHGTKSGGPKLLGAWDLCMPGTEDDASVLVSAYFLNSYWVIFRLLSTLLCKLNCVHASAVDGPE